MGMTIEEHIGVIEDLKSTMNVCMSEPEKTEICTSLSKAISTMRKHQKLQADYENRLKADMTAMLTEIQLEIAELPVHVVSNMGSIIHMEIAPSAEDVYEVIQQKINKLKAESENT